MGNDAGGTLTEPGRWDRRRGERPQRPLRRFAGRPVAQFALTGLAAVVLLGVAGVQVFRGTGTDEAIRNASGITRLAGVGIIAPQLSTDVLRGRPAAIARLDRIVRERVLRDPIVRVKVWTARGRIVYSDEHRLIGSHYGLSRSELEALASGTTDAELSDLSRPENRFERPQRKLLEVYLGLPASHGRRLLFETYERFGSVSASGRRLWLAFAPALIAALLLLEAVQIPLARRLARRLRQGQHEREKLLQQAVESSELERRRIAHDLHDGVVQNLAGVSYSLAAARERIDPERDAAVRESVEHAAGEVRRSIRELRSLLVDLYPASLQREGLEAALSDLLAPLAVRRIETRLDVDTAKGLPPHTEALLFRSAQEAVRNAVDHAEPHSISVRVRADDERAVLEVLDDGRGFDSEGNGVGGGDDHFGLRLLEDAARSGGGRLDVRSAPGEGTRVRLEVPNP